jgi:hypothetical protein
MASYYGSSSNVCQAYCPPRHLARLEPLVFLVGCYNKASCDLQSHESTKFSRDGLPLLWPIRRVFQCRSLHELLVRKLPYGPVTFARSLRPLPIQLQSAIVGAVSTEFRRCEGLTRRFISAWPYLLEEHLACIVNLFRTELQHLVGSCGLKPVIALCNVHLTPLQWAPDPPKMST